MLISISFLPPTPLTPEPHHRPGLESMSDRVTLTDYEARRLLNAIVKEFVQMTAEELEQQASEGNRYTHDFFLSPPPPDTHTFSSQCRKQQLKDLEGWNSLD